jgi:predicted HTH transcriptional regulator
MPIDTVLAQAALGEDSTHQFKMDVRNAESLAAEMVGFANSGGGTLFTGVADDDTTAGLSVIAGHLIQDYLPYEATLYGETGCPTALKRHCY